MKTCNADCTYELMKGCKFGAGLDKEGNLKCTCKKNCAMCTVGGKVTTALKIKPEKTAKQAETSMNPRQVKRIAPKLPREFLSHRVPIWMHPEMHEAYIKSQARHIKGNNPKTMKEPSEIKEPIELKMSGGPSAARKDHKKKQEVIDAAKELVNEINGYKVKQ